jgi:hypothetical protein
MILPLPNGLCANAQAACAHDAQAVACHELLGGPGVRRGVTLIEAVLFIAVALGLIVGGLVFYQQASRSATHQAVVRELQVVQGEVRGLYQVSKWDRLVTSQENMVPTLIAMEAIPRGMVSSTHANQIRLAYGGQLQVQHLTNTTGAQIANWHFQNNYVLHNVPPWLCTRLVVTDKVRGVLTDGRAVDRPNLDGIIDVGNGVISDMYEIQFRSLVTGVTRFHRFHDRITTSPPPTHLAI